MPVPDLEPAATQVRRLLDGVTDADLRRPTPCGYDVAALLDHLMGLSLAFTWAAEKSGPAGDGDPGEPDGNRLDPGWRTVLPERLDQLVAAWRGPTAAQGTTSAGGITLPGEVAGLVALDELVLHGWDLARATGQPFGCDDVSTQAVLAFAAETARPENAAQREGLFGPVVPVPDDAPTLDRALGLAGRDPAWSPGRRPPGRRPPGRRPPGP